MQITCTALVTDNHASNPLLIFTDPMLFVTPNQKCQRTEGKIRTGMTNYTHRTVSDRIGPHRKPHRTQVTSETKPNPNPNTNPTMLTLTLYLPYQFHETLTPDGVRCGSSGTGVTLSV